MDNERERESLLGTGRYENPRFGMRRERERRVDKEWNGRRAVERSEETGGKEMIRTRARKKNAAAYRRLRQTD